MVTTSRENIILKKYYFTKTEQDFTAFFSASGNLKLERIQFFKNNLPASGNYGESNF